MLSYYTFLFLISKVWVGFVGNMMIPIQYNFCSESD